MVLDGVLADPEHRGDGPVGLAERESPQDVQFTTGQVRAEIVASGLSGAGGTGEILGGQGADPAVPSTAALDTEGPEHVRRHLESGLARGMEGGVVAHVGVPRHHLEAKGREAPAARQPQSADCVAGSASPGGQEVADVGTPVTVRSQFERSAPAVLGDHRDGPGGVVPPTLSVGMQVDEGLGVRTVVGGGNGRPPGDLGVLAGPGYVVRVRLLECAQAHDSVAQDGAGANSGRGHGSKSRTASEAREALASTIEGVVR